MAKAEDSLRVGVDIGGTFVDAIEFNRETQTIEVAKEPTTPENLTEGVSATLESVGSDLEAVEALIHGTTVGLNAILEREGSNVGLVTTEGFKDVLEISRGNVPTDDMYNIHYEGPPPLIPRRRRVEVPERLDNDGEVVTPLDEDTVEEAADHLVEEHGVDSIAICFLHSYRNSDHEERAAELIREQYPDITVSGSSEVVSEWREYERTSTVTLDAYIKPLFDSYINNIDTMLEDKGFDGSFQLTRSGGGVVPSGEASESPIHTVLSGPAGGLIGASYLADKMGRENIIAIDMGGTSVDACVIQGKSANVTYQTSLETFPLLIPTYDIRTIGAGGGSIAWLDGELLKVGPQSAGADPGPVCYGRGGTEPTVTDAALELGFIDSEKFLGGEMDLEAQQASDAIRKNIAEPLEQTNREASRGIIDVLVANIANAIREITVEKGLDPRDFSVMAYGGAGPMLMPLLAREIETKETIIPQAPAVFSAWGMLQADTTFDFSQTITKLTENVGIDDVKAAFEDLDQQATQTLENIGFSSKSISLQHTVDMRYFGQGHDDEVDAEGVQSIDELVTRFQETHEERYGYRMNDPSQVVNIRVRAIGEYDKPGIQQIAQSDDIGQIETNDAYCFAEQSLTPFDIYDRAPLSEEEQITGPAIIREPTSTTVFYSDQQATIDEFGNIVIQ